MSRISRGFENARARGEKALITYIMAGDPSIEKTKDLVFVLEEGGADIIELGVPFSDPLADGPVIQRASERALASGTTLDMVLSLVGDVRKRSDIPIILMTYYNIIFRYGEERFVKDAASQGVDGFIIPDLPPEEGENLIHLSRAGGLDAVFLLAPTSTEDRISLVSKRSTGFIYYVSLTGVTGIREGISEAVGPMVQKIKMHTSKPVAVGFGISTPSQASDIAEYADGVVIGSAIVRIVEDKAESRDLLPSVSNFARKIKEGIRCTP